MTIHRLTVGETDYHLQLDRVPVLNDPDRVVLNGSVYAPGPPETPLLLDGGSQVFVITDMADEAEAAEFVGKLIENGRLAVEA